MKRSILYCLLIASTPLLSQQNNYSLQFDGADDYVEIMGEPLNGFTATDSFSILFWVKPIFNNNCQALAVKGTGGFWEYGFWKSCWPDGPSGNSGPENAAMFGYHAHHNTFTNDSISSLSWSFIAGTYNRGFWKLYLNGKLQQSFGKDLFTSYGGPLTLGRKGFSDQGYFEGKMDELSWWKDDLDSLQIQELMLCPPAGTEDGLVGYWKFEEGSGIISADASTNSNDGKLFGGVTWSNDAPSFQCNSSTSTPVNSSFYISPNPSGDFIQVKLATVLHGEVILTDLLGNEVLKQEINGQETQLDLLSLPAKGTYFVQVLSKEGRTLGVSKLMYL